MDTTLAILVLVAIIYVLIIIGAVVFIVSRKRGVFKQTIDPMPIQQFTNEKESKKK
ncbi:hypothetical protein ACQKMN_15585 [Ureibacillus composti]